jgi:SAM-dependent methyltransferase
MGTKRWGTGLELGAGTGYASAALSRRAGVERIYVHDQSPELVRDVMPEMFRAGGADEAKLVRVIGDLGRFELPDASLDFVLAIAALHHAEDLGATVREIERVLRAGGFALVFDRFQPDYLTRADIERELRIPVDPGARAMYGVDAGTTRADLGEHEIRLAEWKYHFMQGDFEVYAFTAFTFAYTWWAKLIGPPWRAFLERFGDRVVFARRRTELLGAQLPLDVRWLMRTDPPSPTNLFLAARKYS